MSGQEKKCSNCNWFMQDVYQCGYRCYFNPPSIMCHGGSVRPVVGINEKACSSWKEIEKE